MMKNILISTIYAPNGGVKTMRSFIDATLKKEGFKVSVAYYQPYSITPDISVPLWKLLQKKPNFNQVMIDDSTHYEMGTYLPELEFKRYTDTRYWEQVVQGQDYFLCVSGYSLPAYPFIKMNLPFIGWFATTYADDRVGRKTSTVRKILELLNYPICIGLENKILTSSNYCFALSHYTKTLMEKQIDNKKSFDVLPMPIDTNVFFPLQETKESLSIVLAGRFEDPRKNFSLALESISYLLHQKKISITLYAVGDIPSAETIETIKKLNIEKNIVFLNYITREELAKYYQKSKIFLLTSFQEGLGIVIFEAMACGAIPVVTKCGGPESVIVDNENGFTTDFSAEKIGETIYSILANDNVAKRLSENAIQTIKEKFAYDTIQQKFLNTFYNTIK